MSSGAMGLAAPPRGLRVKNWKVLASMETASRARAANPSEMERWGPM